MKTNLEYLVHLIMLACAFSSIWLMFNDDPYWVAKLDTNYQSKNELIIKTIDSYGNIRSRNVYDNFIDTHKGYFLFRLSRALKVHRWALVGTLYAIFVGTFWFYKRNIYQRTLIDSINVVLYLAYIIVITPILAFALICSFGSAGDFLHT